MSRRIGVCAWSLQPQNPRELAERVRATGLAHVQLALGPLLAGQWSAAETRAALDAAGIGVLSGMLSMHGEDYSSLESIRATGGLRPDRHWERNRAAAERAAALAARLGLKLVSFHAGFLPHDARDPERAVLVARLRTVAEIFAGAGVDLALETGQEDAETLLAVLAELAPSGVGVNFDPANMILYGMGEPVAALRRLAPFVRQIHVKDALPAETPGTWGREVVAGRGAVDWSAFFGVQGGKLAEVDLVIEREAGDDRAGDVRAARALLARHLGGGP